MFKISSVHLEQSFDKYFLYLIYRNIDDLPRHRHFIWRQMEFFFELGSIFYFDSIHFKGTIGHPNVKCKTCKKREMICWKVLEPQWEFQTGRRMTNATICNFSHFERIKHRQPRFLPMSSKFFRHCKAFLGN